jgi:alpha,alpha-trehalase
MNFRYFLITCFVLVGGCVAEDLPPPCPSEIYCHGRIIEMVMTKHIFNDSKTYVDQKLKKPPNETLKSFDDFMATVNNAPSQDQLQAWVESNFDPPGTELENHKPADHKDNIELYNRISDKHFKKFASDLNGIWIELCRKMNKEVEVSVITILWFDDSWCCCRSIQN